MKRREREKPSNYSVVKNEGYSSFLSYAILSFLLLFFSFDFLSFSLSLTHSLTHVRQPFSFHLLLQIFQKVTKIEKKAREEAVKRWMSRRKGQRGKERAYETKRGEDVGEGEWPTIFLAIPRRYKRDFPFSQYNTHTHTHTHTHAHIQVHFASVCACVCVCVCVRERGRRAVQ